MRQKKNIPSKETIRKTMRAKRHSLPQEKAGKLSELACGHILESNVWRSSSCVALYMPVRGEVDTAPLRNEAWRQGKTVLLPLCSSENPGEMTLVACAGPEMLRPGFYAIPEPVIDETALKGNASPMMPDIIVIPGLAFDAYGTRLGMGSGYYDRLLALPPYAHSIRMGLAYLFQTTSTLPRDDWDRPMHAFCTEKGILWISTPNPG